VIDPLVYKNVKIDLQKQGWLERCPEKQLFNVLIKGSASLLPMVKNLHFFANTTENTFYAPFILFFLQMMKANTLQTFRYYLLADKLSTSKRLTASFFILQLRVDSYEGVQFHHQRSWKRPRIESEESVDICSKA